MDVCMQMIVHKQSEVISQLLHKNLSVSSDAPLPANSPIKSPSKTIIDTTTTTITANNTATTATAGGAKTPARSSPSKSPSSPISPSLSPLPTPPYPLAIPPYPLPPPVLAPYAAYQMPVMPITLSKGTQNTVIPVLSDHP